MNAGTLLGKLLGIDQKYPEQNARQKKAVCLDRLGEEG